MLTISARRRRKASYFAEKVGEKSHVTCVVYDIFKGTNAANAKLFPKFGRQTAHAALAAEGLQ